VRQQQATVDTVTAQHLRSVIARPEQPRPTNGRGRATSGNGGSQQVQPGRDGSVAGDGRLSTFNYQNTIGHFVAYVVLVQVGLLA